MTDNTLPMRALGPLARRAPLQKLDMTAPKWNPIANPIPSKPRKFYSPSIGGFLTEEIHGTALPQDAVEITYDEWQALLAAQSTQGKQIVPGPSGKPIAADPIVTPAMKRAAIQAQIDQIRRHSDTLDLHRATVLGKPGAKEQLAAIDAQIEALKATLPPIDPSDGAAS